MLKEVVQAMNEFIKSLDFAYYEFEPYSESTVYSAHSWMLYCHNPEGKTNTAGPSAHQLLFCLEMAIYLFMIKKMMYWW